MSLFDDLDAETIHDNHVIDRRELSKFAFGWCGNKSLDLKFILPHLPYRKGWVDMFGGSGIVTAARAVSKFEVYNDNFSGVTDFFRCIREQQLYPKLVELLNTYLHSREEWYRCFSTWKDTQDVVERAAKWYYMNYYSHSAVGRTLGRQKNSRNTLSGTHLSKTMHFRTLHERFKGVFIENLDFRTMFKDYSHPETIIYCDPPYLETDKTNYFGSKFDEGDHKDLLACIFNSSSYVAVSGHPNKLYEKYPWTYRHEWKHFSVHTEDGQERTEVLWIKEN